MQIAILGRQPKISLAELESIYGAESITPIFNYAALVKSDDILPQPMLGGTIKSAKILARLEDTNLESAFLYLQSSVPDHLGSLPEGKLQFGISIYGFKAQKNWLLRQMLELKKIIRKNGRSVRIIENKSEELEAAQILYNKLTGPLGWELLIIKDGTDVILAQTYAVQDIDAYATRDHGRPMRDARVGMLPPKLAQILVNLAVGITQNADSSTRTTLRQNSGQANHEQPFDKTQDRRITILDPFCGTGVILQEALLMGYEAQGTDISERMVEYSQQNLAWLSNQVLRQASTYAKVSANKQDDKLEWKVEVGDATSHQWDFSKIQDSSTELFVVCETYLGTPLTTLPNPEKLNVVMNEANMIAEGFLKNISAQLPSGTRICAALPAWYLGNSEFKHLKLLDRISDLGYNRLDLKHASQDDLIYHRENQIVARELTILEKI